MDIILVTTVIASLFVVIGLAEPLAARLQLPYSVILAVLGILIGVSATFFLRTDLTDALNPVAAAILGLPIRSNVFLYVFLPTLLFQATLGMNLRRMVDDWVPILVLAVVAVVVATVSIGYALFWVSAIPLAACLLIGAIVSTTDPSAVVSIFRSISAPRRLARIIEGESLLNDAAAIALFGLFMGYVMLGIPDPELGSALAQFPMLIAGGALVGWLGARIAVWVMALFARHELAQQSISVALPYLAYIVAEQSVGASGVIAVVVSVIIMMAFANPVGRFVNKHPTVQLLGLAFLILIGFMLIAEAAHLSHLVIFDQEVGTIPKGYLYFTIAFSLFIEFINMRYRKKTSDIVTTVPLEETSDSEKLAWKEKHEAVINSGGLHIVGTERNESRRVDNQLRGRCARQGDVGSTRFYLSLEDSLMKIFASDKTASMMKKLGMKEGEALEHSWLNRTIANAQKKVEGMHYDARKQLLEFDDVANDQRKVIYQLRDELTGTEDVRDRYIAVRENVISDLFAEYISPEVLEEDWDVEGLYSALKNEYATDVPLQKSIDDGLDVDEILKLVIQGFELSHAAKEKAIGSETMRTFEKAVMLRALDHHWKEHLAVMDQLRQSVSLRGYGQKNPVQEYKRESFSMFTLLLETINVEMVKALCSVSVEQEQGVTDEDTPDEKAQTEQPKSEQTKPGSKPNVAQQPKRSTKIGRNDPCPCGSGKKYKHCHG